MLFYTSALVDILSRHFTEILALTNKLWESKADRYEKFELEFCQKYQLDFYYTGMWSIWLDSDSVYVIMMSMLESI